MAPGSSSKSLSFGSVARSSDEKRLALDRRDSFLFSAKNQIKINKIKINKKITTKFNVYSPLLQNLHIVTKPKTTYMYFDEQRAITLAELRHGAIWIII